MNPNYIYLWIINLQFKLQPTNYQNLGLSVWSTWLVNSQCRPYKTTAGDFILPKSAHYTWSLLGSIKRREWSAISSKPDFEVLTTPGKSCIINSRSGIKSLIKTSDFVLSFFVYNWRFQHWLAVSTVSTPLWWLQSTRKWSSSKILNWLILHIKCPILSQPKSVHYIQL